MAPPPPEVQLQIKKIEEEELQPLNALRRNFGKDEIGDSLKNSIGLAGRKGRSYQPNESLMKEIEMKIILQSLKIKPFRENDFPFFSKMSNEEKGELLLAINRQFIELMRGTKKSIFKPSPSNEQIKNLQDAFLFTLQSIPREKRSDLYPREQRMDISDFQIVKYKPGFSRTAPIEANVKALLNVKAQVSETHRQR